MRRGWGARGGAIPLIKQMNNINANSVCVLVRDSDPPHFSADPDLLDNAIKWKIGTFFNNASDNRILI